MNAKALLKQIPVVAYLYAVLGVAIISGIGYYNHVQREIGRREAEISQLEHANRDLRRAQDSLANAYRVDTIRLTKIRTVTDSLTVTVDRWKHDTIRVVEYVTKADSAIRSCVQALQTCEQRVAVATRGWDGARAEIALLKRQAPSPMQKYVYGAGGVGIGVLVHALLKK